MALPANRDGLLIEAPRERVAKVTQGHGHSPFSITVVKTSLSPARDSNVPPRLPYSRR